LRDHTVMDERGGQCVGPSGPHFRVPRPLIGHGRPITGQTGGILA
jgi:hypothetical protein